MATKYKNLPDAGEAYPCPCCGRSLPRHAFVLECFATKQDHTYVGHHVAMNGPRGYRVRGYLGNTFTDEKHGRPRSAA